MGRVKTMCFDAVIAKEQSDCGNLRQGRPPFVASRHFPRFIGDIYPAIKVEAAVWSFVPQSSGSPRYARDDVLFVVIAKERSDCGNPRNRSRSGLYKQRCHPEQTCEGSSGRAKPSDLII